MGKFWHKLNQAKMQRHVGDAHPRRQNWTLHVVDSVVAVVVVAVVIVVTVVGVAAAVVVKALFSLWLWPLLQIKLGRIILLLYISSSTYTVLFSAFMTSWWLSWKTFL